MLKEGVLPLLQGFGYLLFAASPFVAFKGYDAWDKRLAADARHQARMRELEDQKAQLEIRVLAATARAAGAK